MYFQYGTAETEYLSARDAKLGAIISKLGHIEREVTPDLFHGILNSIVGQQISTKAQITIWNRMLYGTDELPPLGDFSPAHIAALPDAQIQQYGISFRKVSYINARRRQFSKAPLTSKPCATCLMQRFVSHCQICPESVFGRRKC